MQPTCSHASGWRCFWLPEPLELALWSQRFTARCHSVHCRVPGSNPATLYAFLIFLWPAGRRFPRSMRKHFNGNTLPLVAGSRNQASADSFSYGIYSVPDGHPVFERNRRVHSLGVHFALVRRAHRFSESTGTPPKLSATAEPNFRRSAVPP